MTTDATSTGSRPTGAPIKGANVGRDAFLEAIRAMGSLPDEPRIETISPATVVPPQFEVVRGSPIPDPQIASVLKDLGRAFRYKSISDSGVYRANGWCVTSAIQFSGRRRALPRPRIKGHEPKDSLPGRWLYAGTLHGHFGHFLTESIGRLWGAGADSAGLAGVLWVTPAPPRPRGKGATRTTHASVEEVNPKSFQVRLASLLGLPARHVIVRQPLRVDELLVPNQLMALDGGEMLSGHPHLRAWLRERLVPRRAVDHEPRRPLFVSRAGLKPPAVSFVLERHVEEVLASAGWDVMRPETLPLEEQLARYSRASHVLFSEGSSSHFYALVAQPWQTALIVRRRQVEKSHLARQLEGVGVAEAALLDLTDGFLKDEGPDDPDPARKRRRASDVPFLDFAALGDELVRRGLLPPGAWRNPTADEIAREVNALIDQWSLAVPGAKMRRVARTQAEPAEDLD